MSKAVKGTLLALEQQLEADEDRLAETRRILQEAQAANKIMFDRRQKTKDDIADIKIRHDLLTFEEMLDYENQFGGRMYDHAKKFFEGVRFQYGHVNHESKQMMLYFTRPDPTVAMKVWVDETYSNLVVMSKAFKTNDAGVTDIGIRTFADEGVYTLKLDPLRLYATITQTQWNIERLRHEGDLKAVLEGVYKILTFREVEYDRDDD